MDFETISVTPRSPRVGTEFSGIDLRAPLSHKQGKEVHQALMQHLVIFFHDQPIDHIVHKDPCGYFGELQIHVGPDSIP